MTDLLALLAEVSVGFTGFAAIASALGSAPSDADARLDRLRLRNLVGWTVCAVLLVAALVALVILHGGRNSVTKAAELEGYSVRSALTLWGLGLSALGVLLVSLIAPNAIRVPFAYVTALWLMTVMPGVYFIRIAASLLTLRLGQD